MDSHSERTATIYYTVNVRVFTTFSISCRVLSLDSRRIVFQQKGAMRGSVGAAFADSRWVHAAVIAASLTMRLYADSQDDALRIAGESRIRVVTTRDTAAG
jgi:acyl-CoA thioesterase FadM